MWTSPFFRQFSVYVAPKDAERAKELIGVHQDEAPPRASPGKKEWLARIILIWMVAGIVVGALGNILYLLR